MRRTLLLAALLALTVCCERRSPEVEAMQAAEAAYATLLSGDYDSFLDSRAGMDSLPESYREQMLTVYRQHLHEQRRAHRDIVSAQATRAQADSTLHLMQVFVLLSYADSTAEEIVVPMMETEQGWKLR